MKRKSVEFVLLLLGAVCLFRPALKAEDGGSYISFAPYSTFALGDIQAPGTAYNRTMGGVGIASRNTRFINILNPAAVTARDSLSFMTDFSICENNILFREGDRHSASNTFNMLDFAISFPLFHKTAMLLGIKPYSATGYSYGDYVTDSKIVSEHGTTEDLFSGQGSIYNLFGAFAYAPVKNLSFGIQYDFYFGDIEKSFTRTFENTSVNGISDISSLLLRGGGAKAGVQYEHSFSKNFSLGIGATYAFRTALRNLSDGTSNASIAPELGIGLSLNFNEKLRGGIDWTRSDWTKSNLSSIDVNTNFAGAVSQAFRFGVEYTPNRMDIRYYRNRISYRAGGYYRTEYYTVCGEQVRSAALTFGMTLPVFRWSNGLTLGVEAGQRGVPSTNAVRESFVGFSIGVNLYDIWFQKMMYE